jgi:hypothetical protein
VLAGSRASLAQDRRPDAPAPAIQAAMPNTIKLDRLDGSILLIGIERQESNRINFSTVSRPAVRRSRSFARPVGEMRCVTC